MRAKSLWKSRNMDGGIPTSPKNERRRMIYQKPPTMRKSAQNIRIHRHEAFSSQPQDAGKGLSKQFLQPSRTTMPLLRETQPPMLRPRTNIASRLPRNELCSKQRPRSSMPYARTCGSCSMRSNHSKDTLRYSKTRQLMNHIPMFLACCKLFAVPPVPATSDLKIDTFWSNLTNMSEQKRRRQ
jgi:hypothetical protein